MTTDASITDWAGNEYPDTPQGYADCAAWTAAHPKPDPPPPPSLLPPELMTLRIKPGALPLLLTTAERFKYHAIVASVQGSDYASTDPQRQAVAALADFSYVLDRLDPSEASLNMGDPQTKAAIHLLAQLVCDPAQPWREGEILDGEPPGSSQLRD